jgi:ATP-dependent DNA helicase RecG
LVIVDEQHRFGVLQRFKLMKKTNDKKLDHQASLLVISDRRAPAAGPDVLVMTATPIPRTLALTLYGDLDMSILDEMPPGRTPVLTRCVGDNRSAEVWEFVRQQVSRGHQAYVVYPVIEDNQENELKAAMKMYGELSKKIFPDLKLAVLHGRMDGETKELTMKLFHQGEIQILVSTTVIEVGVDVANATIMVIEHAERFGLAQLHQLRGRIGRGPGKSYCILMTGKKVSEQGERRLAAMVGTSDGFQLAELDLELRGPGEFLGTRQAGLPSFQIAHLVRDRHLLELAKQEARAVLAGPSEDIPQGEIDRALRQMRARWEKHYGLAEVG